MSLPRVAIALLAIGGLIAAATQLPLDWDGSYIALNVLWAQEPFMPHGRWVNLPLQALALVASRWISDTDTLAVIFGAAYSLIPAAALAASWWVVRDREPRMLVWPALGIGLLALPGQAFFVSEAMLAVQLVWPLVLAVALDVVHRHRFLLGCLALALAFAHPVAVGLLGMILIMWVVTPSMRWPIRRRLAVGALALVVVIALGLRYFAGANSYESEQVSLATLSSQAQTLDTARLAAIGLVYFAAITLLLGAAVHGRERRALELVALIPLAPAAGLMMLWAVDPHGWVQALEYRGLVLFVTAGLYGAAYLDAHSPLAANARRPIETPARGVAVVGAAATWLLVVSVQGLSWHATLDDFYGYLERSPTACVPAANIGGIERSPLNHWSVTPLSLMLAGREPGRIVLRGGACEQRLADGFPIEGVEIRPWESRWFAVEPLQRTIAIERSGIAQER